MTKKARHTPREVMELAIEFMRQSVREPRDDGKVSPKVGAVLVYPDGTVEASVLQTRFLQSGTCKKRRCRTMDVNAEKWCERIV